MSGNSFDRTQSQSSVGASRRRYMDNSATSFPKPIAVHEAMARYATELGASAGRGGYQEAMATGQLLGECRHRLNTLLHGQNPDHFIFTLNCTDALNLAIKGLVEPGRRGHAVCTHIDHNSVLRPLYALGELGLMEHTSVPVDGKTGLVDPDDIRRAIRSDTRLIAVTHVSNVTGTIQPLREISRIAREHGVSLVVDAAQAAGHVPIDLQADGIDLLAAPGHKGLLGPLGTGFLYIRPGLEKILRPQREGGTGSVSDQPRQPDFMPDKFECGSHNAIGLIGLLEGVNWVARQTVDKIHKQQQELIATMIAGLSGIEGLTLYGPPGVKDRSGVFSVRIEGFEPAELSAVLESHYGILTRSGIHCAPLAHAALGTAAVGGTTRFSFGPFLGIEDVTYATDALAQIASSRIVPVKA